MVWTASGKQQEGAMIGEEEDEYDASDFNKTLNDFFNKADA